MSPDLCDHVGGTCYEQLPEGQLLLYLIVVMVVLHVLLVAVPIWLQSDPST